MALVKWGACGDEYNTSPTRKFWYQAFLWTTASIWSILGWFKAVLHNNWCYSRRRWCNNCDEVVTTGAEIQQSLDWIAASKVLVPRSKNIKNLARMSSGIKVWEKVRDSTIQINKTVLFQQLTASMECTDNLSAFFEYDLTPTPNSLFKDGYLWKANKSDLASALTKNSTKLSTKATYVVDRGALLH